MQLLAKFKNILYMGFRATLNFRKFKVALNSMYRIFSNFAKSCISFSLSKFYNQELSVLHRKASESPQYFLVWAFNLKQQIIFVSNATEGSIKYEPSLVQALFLHVLETGLQDEALRAKLRPLLEVTSVTDEQLMEKVTSAEVEHQNKMGVAGRKGERVNQVETASPPSNQLSQPT